MANALPNAAHKGIADLQQYFNVTVITQNIDDLHERAGSTKVLHLHGEIFKMRSEKSFSFVREIRGDIMIGDCAEDGCQYRPHIVWFEEPVPLIEEAIPIVHGADIFAVVGTSLVVYPAAGLVNYAPLEIPKFIIDRRIPYTSSVYNLTEIELPATEGVKARRTLLKT